MRVCLYCVYMGWYCFVVSHVHVIVLFDVLPIVFVCVWCLCLHMFVYGVYICLMSFYVFVVCVCV